MKLLKRSLRPSFSFERHNDGSVWLCLPGREEQLSVRALATAIELKQDTIDGLTLNIDSNNGTVCVDDAVTVPLSEIEQRRGRSDAFVVDTEPDLGVGRIFDGRVLVGSQDAAVDGDLLRAERVSRVLNVGAVAVASETIDNELAIERLHCPLLDVDEQVISAELIDRCNDFVFANATERVLIHCNAGVSRSVTIAIALLLRHNVCQDAHEALALIRQTRPAAKPNAGFMKYLCKLK